MATTFLPNAASPKKVVALVAMFPPVCFLTCTTAITCKCAHRTPVHLALNFAAPYFQCGVSSNMHRTLTVCMLASIIDKRAAATNIAVPTQKHVTNVHVGVLKHDQPI